MLNRRILRIIAMVNVYEYIANQQASYEASIEKIKENIPLKIQKEYISLFDRLNNNEIIIKNELNDEYYDLIHDIFNTHNSTLKKTYTKIKYGINEFEDAIYDNISLIFLIINSWRNIAKNNLAKNNTLFETVNFTSLNLSLFAENEILLGIEKSSIFEKKMTEILSKKKILKSQIEEWYKEILKNDEKFIKYCNKEIYETPLGILKHIYRNIILNSGPITKCFKEINLLWQVSQKTIGEIIFEIFSSYFHDQNIEQIKNKLTLINESHSDFYFQLIKVTEKWDFFVNILKAKIENWDIDRVYLLDKIIIVMAAFEMQELNISPNIVINEYIDISKDFSTPKSKLFINGILDIFYKEDIKNCR